MKVYCSRNLLIENPTAEVIDYCNDKLVLSNPEYVQKEMMSKWLGNTPKYLYLFEQRGNNLILPFGTIQDIFKLHPHSIDFIGNFAPKMVRNFKSNIELYDYQKRAVSQALEVKNGVLVMPCGSGKTQSGLEIIARLGLKTLWLTHTQDLLNQSRDRAMACFDLPLSEYGKITEGKINIGNSITFATVQTMCNIDLNKYSNEWNVVIVDECHHCIGSPTRMMMFYKVINNLNARCKFGLTATPKRADGLEKAMYSILGNKICEISKSEVAHTTCPVEIRKINTGFIPSECIFASDGTIVYSSLVDEIASSEERNKFIVSKLKEINEPTLVLCDRLKQIDALYKMLSMPDISAKIDGTSQTIIQKEKRKSVLSDLNSGKLRYVFATYKLAKEGLDIPNLRYLVLASPQKDETTIEQSVGRVARRYDGKNKGVVIDLVDNFGLLFGYFKKRNRIYKRNGYVVIDN